MIRYQGSLGQSSDPNGQSYHPDGLPQEPELVEVITAETIAPGGKHRLAFVNANTDDLGNLVQFITAEARIGVEAYQFAREHFASIPEPVSAVLMFIGSSALLANRLPNGKV